MSRALVIPIAAGVMLLACKHSEKLEILASGHTEATRLETSQSDTVTTRSEGPERVTTTVEEFADAAQDGGADPPEAEKAVPANLDRGAADPALVRVPRLVKRTVTIAERGPVIQETRLREASLAESDSHAESVSKAVHEEKSAPAASCAFGGAFLAWAVPLVLLALAWKFRALIPWWPWK